MFNYVPTFVPNKVLIIGGGGTGSRLVPLLAQFLKTCAWIQNPEITIVDDDRVEEKNLLRQNFIAIDVDKPKAEVLAQRYSRAFNIPIVPMVRRITPANNNSTTVEGKEDNLAQKQLFQRYANNAIIVMCVDSPEARRHIVGRIMEANNGSHNNNILLIDSGNENDFGQISVSSAKLVDVGYWGETLDSWNNKMPGDATLPIIPMDLAYFEEMKAETTLSCADLDQTMAINTMMAVTMFGIIQNFVYAKPISFHRLNVSLSHGVTSEYMNPRFISRVKSIAKSLSDPFTQKEASVFATAVRVDGVIRDFNETTFLPMDKALKKAEADNKALETKAIAVRDKEVGEQAVKAAMALYGWKMPEASTKEIESPKVESSLTKKEREQLVEELKQDFLTLAEGKKNSSKSSSTPSTSTATVTPTPAGRSSRTGTRREATRVIPANYTLDELDL